VATHGRTALKRPLGSVFAVVGLLGVMVGVSGCLLGGDTLAVGSGAWKGVYRIQKEGLSAELSHPSERVRQDVLYKTELAELRKISSGG
jgi:hypothetical protein